MTRLAKSEAIIRFFFAFVKNNFRLLFANPGIHPGTSAGDRPGDVCDRRAHMVAKYVGTEGYTGCLRGMGVAFVQGRHSDR
jgi:hypothetical protein